MWLWISCNSEIIINLICFRPFNSDEVPVKKLKKEPKSEEELKEEKEKEKKMEKQNKLFHKYRKALSELNKSDMEELLEENSQEVPAGRDEVNWNKKYFTFLVLPNNFKCLGLIIC